MDRTATTADVAPGQGADNGTTAHKDASARLLEHLDGRTRLYLILDTPIAQVKSPQGVTQTLQQRGHNAASYEFQTFLDHNGATALNLQGEQTDTFPKH